MAIILNIDTAIDVASVCVASGEEVLDLAVNNNQKDHAAWIHEAIEKLLSNQALAIHQLNAVAVTIGPGSYTGLRVGLSTAKGICYAQQIPLISINTLEVMAHSLKDEEADFFCPMIDARRMEVFTAAYNRQLEEVIKPCAMIIDGNNFNSLLFAGKVLFSGNGNEKLKKIISHSNASFISKAATAADMCQLSAHQLAAGNFADTAYAEPLYLKEFYSVAY
jgi:tRNA threonylcarbamoyladenosine biosynthesis protein TsaB